MRSFTFALPGWFTLPDTLPRSTDAVSSSWLPAHYGFTPPHVLRGLFFGYVTPARCGCTVATRARTARSFGSGSLIHV